MPLNRKVNFKTTLKRRNLLQVPNVIRWEFKMKVNEILKVPLKEAGLFCSIKTFLTKMHEDGFTGLADI